MRIPYQLTEFKNGDVIVKEHSYFPDFYYELNQMMNLDVTFKMRQFMTTLI